MVYANSALEKESAFGIYQCQSKISKTGLKIRVVSPLRTIKMSCKKKQKLYSYLFNSLFLICNVPIFPFEEKEGNFENFTSFNIVTG